MSKGVFSSGIALTAAYLRRQIRIWHGLCFVLNDGPVPMAVLARGQRRSFVNGGATGWSAAATDARLFHFCSLVRGKPLCRTLLHPPNPWKRPHRMNRKPRAGPHGAGGVIFFPARVR